MTGINGENMRKDKDTRDADILIEALDKIIQKTIQKQDEEMAALDEAIQKIEAENEVLRAEIERLEANKAKA